MTKVGHKKPRLNYWYIDKSCVLAYSFVMKIEGREGTKCL